MLASVGTTVERTGGKQRGRQSHGSSVEGGHFWDGFKARVNSVTLTGHTTTDSVNHIYASCALRLIRHGSCRLTYISHILHISYVCVYVVTLGK